jgi:hypothetical protein
LMSWLMSWLVARGTGGRRGGGRVAACRAEEAQHHAACLVHAHMHTVSPACGRQPHTTNTTHARPHTHAHARASARKRRSKVLRRQPACTLSRTATLTPPLCPRLAAWTWWCRPCRACCWAGECVWARAGLS